MSIATAPLTASAPAAHPPTGRVATPPIDTGAATSESRVAAQPVEAGVPRAARPMLDEAAQLLSRHIDDESRATVDAALTLLVGPDGAGLPHLRPGPDTPDIVRHRIAGRALGRLANEPDAAARVVGRAIALLRA